MKQIVHCEYEEDPMKHHCLNRMPNHKCSAELGTCMYQRLEEKE